MTDTFTIRPYETPDHNAIVLLYEAAKPLGMTIPEVSTDDACRLVVGGETGKIVGYGAASRGETASLSLVVHPDRQRQGIGCRLWEHLCQNVSACGTVAFEPWVRQENESGVAWLEKNGFVQIKLDGPVSLILAGADLDAFQSVLSHVTEQGITITTLAEEKIQNPSCLPKLHMLYTTVEADVPGNDPDAMRPLEEFVKEWGESDALLFLAKDGEQYVGLSTAAPRGADPHFEERNDIFQQYLTGVMREYRQRGIATALKLQVIAHAQREGYRTLWTNSGNPAMRALNWKLGFRTGPWLVYRKILAKETANA